MSGCTSVQRCSTTASKGRKFVETMARPRACAMAQRTMSSAGLSRNSALAFAIWSAVMGENLVEEIPPAQTDWSFSSRNCDLLLPKHAGAPIAEALSGISLLRVTRQQGSQLALDVRVLECFFPDSIEPRAGDIAAEPDLITPGRFADERDLRHVGPRAAVRATCRADDDFLAAQPDFLTKQFDPVHQTRQHPLGLSQRQTAGRQRRARQRRGVQRASLVLNRHAVLCEQRGDGVLIALVNVGKDDVLIGGEAELDFAESFPLGYAPQRGFHLAAFDILHAACLDEQREKPAAIHLLVPTVKIAHGREQEWTRRGEF